jgi:Rrf2 family protein
MRISAAEKYGLRCLVALARGGPQVQLSIPDLAKREQLSVPYVSKLLAILRRAGLVHSERGRTGGFWIEREPAEITLLEVLSALGGPLLDTNRCTRQAEQPDRCDRQDRCSIHNVLDGLAGYMSEILSNTTLQDMLTYEDMVKKQAKTKKIIDLDSLVGDKKTAIAVSSPSIKRKSKTARESVHAR